MGVRRRGRVLAFQSLYRFDLSQATQDELLDFSWYGEDRISKLTDETLAFARLLISGTVENIKAVDQAIRENIEHWDFDRLSRVDLAILRVSVYCLLFQEDIPATVTIDEAVMIAKEYSSDEAYKFINGVLDGIRKKSPDDKGPDKPGTFGKKE
ncbi:MAG: transcription antitermination factor NusB [Spirochaetaceae bacterium]|nr:MAG: transcription antitermination factor NusB [Spirochaetaceae bacterium]